MQINLSQGTQHVQLKQTRTMASAGPWPAGDDGFDGAEHVGRWCHGYSDGQFAGNRLENYPDVPSFSGTTRIDAIDEPGTCDVLITIVASSVVSRT